MSKAKSPKRAKFSTWIEDLSVTERLELARKTLEGISNVAHFLVNLHESNEILLKTDTISKQIPHSYAGNAYNAVTRGLRDIELVRICSLWDPAGYDTFTLPTVVEIFDNPDVIEHMARQIAGHRFEILKVARLADYDEEDRTLIEEALKRMASREWREEYEWVRRTSRNTIYLARVVGRSKTLKNVRNFRNKHIAHALAATRLEHEKGEPLPLPVIGDEARLLRVTIKLLKRLEQCVRDVSFDWTESQQIAKRNAEALWHGVTVKVLR